MLLSSSFSVVLSVLALTESGAGSFFGFRSDIDEVKVDESCCCGCVCGLCIGVVGLISVCGPSTLLS